MSVRDPNKIPDTYYRDVDKRHAQIYRYQTCEYCGSKELTIPLPGNQYTFFCPRCALNLPTIDILSRQGRVILAPNWAGSLTCNNCGSRAPVMYGVLFKRVCFKCAWYRLGHARRALKVEGRRVV